MVPGAVVRAGVVDDILPVIPIVAAAVVLQSLPLTLLLTFAQVCLFMHCWFWKACNAIC